MGKGARTREANAPKIREKQEKLQQETARKKRSRRIAQVCTAVVALILVGALIFTGINTASLNKGTKMRDTVVAESANYQVDGAMFSYFVHYYYQNYLTQYNSYLSMMGLDPNRSLKHQMYSEKETWFDMFASSAETMVQQYLVLNEAAKEAGVTLTEKEQEIAAAKAKEFDTTHFGRGVNNDDMDRVFDLSVLASKFYRTKLAEFEPTPDDISKKYDEKPEAYQYVDYYSYTIAYEPKDLLESSSASSAEEKEVQKLTKAEARELADELAASKNGEEFTDWVVEYTKKNAEKELTDEEIEKLKTNILSQKVSYVDDNETSKWAFEAKVNDTYVAESSNSFIVYSLKSEAARVEDETIDVRHILVATEDEAKAIMDEFLAGDKTEEAFGLLAFEHSTDGGSVDYGGLYENVTKGSMVPEFDEWCFDAARKEGDCEIVKTDFGYHVMLFCGEGMDVWQASVRNTIVNEAYTNYYEELKINYPVTFHKDLYDVVEA